MPDIATLGLRIEYGSVVQGGNALDTFTAKAIGAEGAAKRFERVQTAGSIAAQQARAALRAEAEAYQALQAQSAISATRTEALTVATGRSVEGLGRFKNAIANLGLSAIGIQGPMQKIVETIAILSVGSTVVTSVLAAVAALAIGFAKLTEQTRKAQDAYDKYMDSLRKTGPLDAIGGQLDAVQHKLDNMGAGFLGGATRFTRAVLSRSLLGQLFGVQSEAELRQQATDLGKQYEDAFRFGQNDAFAKGRAAADERQRKALAEIEARKKAEIEYWNIRNNGQTTFRGNLPLEFGGQGGTFGPAGSDVPEFLRGQRPGGLPAFRAAAEDTKRIAENWQSVAASVANTVTLLANADDATSRWLGNVVNLVGAIADANAEIKAAGSLSTGGTLGLIGAGVGLISGLLGESAADRRARQIFEENTKAIRDLTRSLNTANLGITGSGYSAARAGTTGLLAAGAGGLSYGQFLALDRATIQGILATAGTNLTELKDFAKELGITLNTDGPLAFIESLKQLDRALKEVALVRLKDFAGQLDLINRQWALGGVTDPLKKMGDLLKLIQGEQGAGALGKALGSFDLGSLGGRTAALGFLQDQLKRAQSGQLTTAELGGLTVQQYLDFLSQFGQLLNEANASLKATVDNLRSFADSLKLDPGLTTLSPAQQLAEARRQYETVLAAAQGGDQAAAGRLPDVARLFLQASRGFNASGPAYAADFARVLAETEAVAKMFEGQADGFRRLEQPLVNVKDNTKQTVEELQTLVALQKEAMQQTIDKLDALAVEQSAQGRALAQALEGRGL